MRSFSESLVLRPLALPLVGLLGVALFSALPAEAEPPDVDSRPGERIELGTQAGSGVSTATVPLASPAHARSAHGAGRVHRFDTATYSMVGFTWQAGGDPELEVRTRSAAGWSDWTHLHVLGDGPTRRTPEARASRVAGATEAAWVGDSDGIEVRVGGAEAGGLEMVLLDPGSPAPVTAQSAAGRATAERVAKPKKKAKGKQAKKAKNKKARKRPKAAPRPPLRSRKNWGADESLRSGEPRYTGRLKQVHVHHTAGSNEYGKKDVKGILRGIYAYHTRSLGWSDIGYNFLVDRFGRAWTGRAGGVGKRVQGAHTLGFNHKSTGISVIGNLETVAPTPETITTVAKLAAWKLDRDDRRASGQVNIISKGSNRYSSGTKVRLPRIDGHRDTNSTACPGELLYAALPEIRQRAQKRIDRY